MAWHSDARSLERQGYPAGVPHQEPGRHHLPTTGGRSTRTWRRCRTGGMCSCSSPARRRSTARPGRGSTTRRSTSGLPRTCTGFVSRRCGITCGPGNSRPPAWTGPRSWRVEAGEQAGAARRRARWPAPPTPAPRRGSRRSWSKEAAAGQPSSTIAVSSQAGRRPVRNPPRHAQGCCSSTNGRLRVSLSPRSLARRERPEPTRFVAAAAACGVAIAVVSGSARSSSSIGLSQPSRRNGTSPECCPAFSTAPGPVSDAGDSSASTGTPASTRAAAEEFTSASVMGLASDAVVSGLGAMSCKRAMIRSWARSARWSPVGRRAGRGSG